MHLHVFSSLSELWIHSVSSSSSALRCSPFPLPMFVAPLLTERAWLALFSTSFHSAEKVISESAVHTAAKNKLYNSHPRLVSISFYFRMRRIVRVLCLKSPGWVFFPFGPFAHYSFYVFRFSWFPLRFSSECFFCPYCFFFLTYSWVFIRAYTKFVWKWWYMFWRV